jgi:hypothetical protein
VLLWFESVADGSALVLHVYGMVSGAVCCFALSRVDVISHNVTPISTCTIASKDQAINCSGGPSRCEAVRAVAGVPCERGHRSSTLEFMPKQPTNSRSTSWRLCTRPGSRLQPRAREPSSSSTCAAGAEPVVPKGG